MEVAKLWECIMSTTRKPMVKNKRLISSPSLSFVRLDPPGVALFLLGMR